MSTEESGSDTKRATLAEADVDKVLALCKESYEKYNAVMADKEFWSRARMVDQMKVRTGKYPESNFDVAVATMMSPCTLKQIRGYLTDGLQLDVDEGSQEATKLGVTWRKLIQRARRDDIVVQTVVSSPTPLVKPRETIMYQTTILDNTKEILLSAVTDSSLNKLLPPVPGVVRMKCPQNIIHFHALDEGCKATMVLHADPCGKIPGPLYNLGVTKQLGLLATLVRGAEEYSKLDGNKYRKCLKKAKKEASSKTKEKQEPEKGIGAE